jgi:phage replication-related protein YjqB (UPF0714/DUF867 family)
VRRHGSPSNALLRNTLAHAAASATSSNKSTSVVDRYSSFAQLAAGEVEGRDYQIRVLDRPASQVAVVAPHGGGIERGTSELAELIAGQDHSLFAFEGLKAHGNRELHITSHRFDHPASLAMLARHAVAVGVHGCRGERHIYVGGRDLRLRALLATRLVTQGFDAAADGHAYAGTHPLNICNRTSRSCGAQLELTWDLRDTAVRVTIAHIVAGALAEHVRHLALG